MTLDALLESVLFAAAKPLNVKRLSDLVQAKSEEVVEALGQLAQRLATSGSGLVLQHQTQVYELVSHPQAAECVRRVVHDDTTGELTRPSLETLSILAYCGPMTRPEVEQIRGVQCSMILRNLMLRGFVEEHEDVRLGQPMYRVTFAFLNHLGVQGVETLPEYQALRGHETVTDVLAELQGVSVGTEAAPALNV